MEVVELLEIVKSGENIVLPAVLIYLSICFDRFNKRLDNLIALIAKLTIEATGKN